MLLVKKSLFAAWKQVRGLGRHFRGLEAESRCGLRFAVTCSLKTNMSSAATISLSKLKHIILRKGTFVLFFFGLAVGQAKLPADEQLIRLKLILRPCWAISAWVLPGCRDAWERLLVHRIL